MLEQPQQQRSPESPDGTGAATLWSVAAAQGDGALALASVPAPIRVALSDDRTVARGGLRALLDEESDIEVVDAGSDVDAVAVEVGEHRPDVLVIDLATPDQCAVTAIANLSAQVPGTQIVVLASERDASCAPALLNAGALGFVTREAIDYDLSPAVRAAARGERYVSVRAETAFKAPSRAPGQDRLTARETEVLRLIALGHTSVEIAQALHLSPRTVETHRARIHKKLELATRAELVRYALRRGLLRA